MTDKSSDSEGEKDNSSASVLERLQQYADTWLDEEGYQKYVRKVRTKSKNSRISSKNLEIKSSNEKTGSVLITTSRRQKKKERRRNKEISSNVTSETKTDCTGIKTKVSAKRKANRHIEQFKSVLELESAESFLKDQKKSANKQKSSKTDVILNGIEDKVYVFEDPAKRKRKKISVTSPTKGKLCSIEHSELATDSAQPEINLRDARHDVKMFGITGFQGEKKETAITDMLIKLGAKPPKKSFHNYKEYMEMRKQEISQAKDRHEMGRKFGIKSSKGDKKRRKRKDEIGYLDGQIGSYRSGVQILQKDDIHRVKKFKVKK